MNKRVINTVKYYVLCNKLKDVIRTGWKNWNIKRERLESVAEHIFGTESLALAIYSEYNYDIDIKKVIYMLSVHELEEIIIGDLTCFDITHEEKKILGHKAVEEILNGMLKEEEIKLLIYEFDERKTKEALFAYHCDKLECDIQCKLYDEELNIDIYNEENQEMLSENEVQKVISSGAKTLSEMWLTFDEKIYLDDENFTEILNYVKDNKISLK